MTDPAGALYRPGPLRPGLRPGQQPLGLDRRGAHLQLAQRLGSLVESTPVFELLAPVPLSAVCFRYVGSGNFPEVELNRLNKEILRRINERGRLYLSNAVLHSKFCLRACVVNHRTTEADVEAVLAEALFAAREVLGH